MNDTYILYIMHNIQVHIQYILVNDYRYMYSCLLYVACQRGDGTVQITVSSFTMRTSCVCIRVVKSEAECSHLVLCVVD